MRESATVIRQGEHLTPDLATALEGSERGAICAVRVQKLSPEDAAFFIETRAKVQEGIADIENGDVVDAGDFYAEIGRKYAIKA